MPGPKMAELRFSSGDCVFSALGLISGNLEATGRLYDTHLSGPDL